MLGITNIVVFAGKRSRRTLLINKKVTGTGMTGFVWNATINIFGDKKTANVCAPGKCRNYDFTDLMKKTEEFIENKLIWKAKQYSLPTEFAFYFKDLSNDVQSSFFAQIDVTTSGKPVLLFTSQAKEWTLICTRQVIGKDKKGILSLDFGDIKQIFSAEIGPTLKSQAVGHKSIKPKTEWNEIAIIDRNDFSHSFYANRGSDLFSLWNILLMVKRLSTE
ncbi:MAG: hypothetical protein JST42_09760 [Bacteroidetes bacterium]|nr:hypothetical protein [Bacteroidota bacterium]